MTPAELVARWAEAGRKTYEDHGEVAPMLIMLDDTFSGLAVASAPTDQVADSLARMLWISRGLLPVRYGITVTEAWVKMFSKDDDTSRLQRGDLAKAHENLDLAVKTCIVTTCAEVGSTEMQMDLSTNIGLDRVEWKIEAKAAQEGHMIDRLLWAITEEPPPPPPLPAADEAGLLWEMVGSSLVVTGFAAHYHRITA